MDGTRLARTFCPAAAIGRCRLLPLRAQPDIRGWCHRVDWIVDHVRSRESGWRSYGCGSHPCRAPVRGLLRGADAAQEVRIGLRRVLSERPPLVAARKALVRTTMSDMGISQHL